MRNKRNPWTHEKTATNLWIFAMILCIVSKFFEGTLLQWLLILSGVATAISAVVYRFRNVRCPHCGSLLMDTRGMPQRCPDCGGKLEESI